MKQKKGELSPRTLKEHAELTLKCKKKWELAVRSGKIKRISKNEMYYELDKDGRTTRFSNPL